MSGEAARAEAIRLDQQIADESWTFVTEQGIPMLQENDYIVLQSDSDSVVRTVAELLCQMFGRYSNEAYQEYAQRFLDRLQERQPRFYP